jgi:L-seryl-tRNA(Ser) seleniumtransferase
VTKTAGDVRRRVPRTDTVLADVRLQPVIARLGRRLVKQHVVKAQSRMRNGTVDAADLVDLVLTDLPDSPASMRPVLNATGVLLHTNLGRAPLSPSAIAALATAAGTTDVELDLTTGRRGQRGRGVLEALTALVPDAEAAHIVNNGAAALLLAATAMASGREIVISRGEMVEIGDGFRLPELLSSTGARLREVGTTNRTTVHDYAAAISNETGIMLKIHPSNFVIKGFVSSPTVAQLAPLGVPIVHDIGSGLLAPHPRLPGEPDATSSLLAGAALVTASGDKLLGGPQCGLLLGRRTVIEQLRRHPLARALRVDKLTFAALEATLRGPATPTAQAVGRRPEQLMARAESLAAELRGRAVDARAVTTSGGVGGGCAPGVVLESAAVSLPEELAARLRIGNPPILSTVKQGRCLVDLLGIDPDVDSDLLSAIDRAGRA